MNISSPRPLHCVHFLDSISLASGGVVRAVLDLCGALARGGNAVTLLTCDDQDVPAAWREKHANVPQIVRIERPRAGFFFSSTAKTTAQAILDQADVLHLHTPWDPANLWFARAARRRQLPYAVTIHGMLDDWSMAQRPLKKRLYLALAAQRMLEHAAAIHCTAEEEQRQAQKWFPHGQSVVLPCAFDGAPFQDLPDRDESRREFGLPADGVPVVLFLGRLHPKKGIERLIDAAAQSKQAGQRLRFVVAGSGEADYERKLRRRVGELNLGDSVQFTGLVVGELKISLYRAADLFVLPTSQENFGLVLIEAMACGTPIVTTRGVDIWREIQAAGAAIVENDAPSILDAIRSILSRPDRGRELGRQGRRWVMTQLDETQLVARYQSFYASITQHAPTHDPPTRQLDPARSEAR